MPAEPSQYSFSAANPNPIAWGAIKDDTEKVLFINQDINNTVYLGNRATITIGGSNTIPLPPNGTVSLAANKTWFAVAANGTANLLIIPGGVAYFQGLTQGFGQLVLPAVMSPNFVTGVSGWSINKNGSAEFNNITIRGSTTIGGVTLIYSGSGLPAVDTLIFSESANGGTDSVGNIYLPGTVTYGQPVAGTFTALQQIVLGGSGPAILEKSASPHMSSGWSAANSSIQLGNGLTIGSSGLTLLQGNNGVQVNSPFFTNGVMGSAFPANPVGTSNNSLTMMGLGAAATPWSFTPQSSGTTMVTATVLYEQDTAVAGMTLGLRFGTGTPPTNGVAVSGTRWGAGSDDSLTPAAITDRAPLTRTDILTLIKGTTYWFDVALSTVNAADKVNIFNPALAWVER